MKSSRPAHQLSFSFGSSERASEDARVARPPTPARRTSEQVVRTGPVVAPVSHAPEAHRLVAELRALVGTTVSLRVHDNRSTMVSLKREQEHLHLRVHHMFLAAGPDVVRALADYARQRSARAGKVLDQYVRENRAAIKPVDVEKHRARKLEAMGRVHDLAAIYASLNERYFQNGVDARIGYGRGSNRRKRSIRMGAYYHETRTILIHPALDRAEVPRYFVELVVYHEMLHQAVPHKKGDTGRRCIHSPEFRQRERLFEHYERARHWERVNLSLLLKPHKPKNPSPRR